MNEKTLIAHVDDTTQQALTEVTEQVSQAISDELGELSAPMQEIKNTMTEINEKFNGFSSVHSSIEELRNLVEASGKAANEILPIYEEISVFKENFKDETKNILQSIQTNEALLADVKKEQERQHAEFATAVSVETQTLAELKSHLSDQKEQATKGFEQISNELAGQFNALKQELHEKSQQLAQQITDIESRLEWQKEQLGQLTQTNEKIMLTLDIIVNLVTPFWKKRK